MFDLLAALVAAVVLITDPNDTVPERPREVFPVTTAAPDDWCIPLETDPSRGQRHWSFFDCVPTADDVARWRSGQ